MADKQKHGTFIHGIAASEHLDSSGERIIIKGVDISSLDKDGTLTWEHKNDSPNQTVGKILEAKKILSEKDCENKNHKYFWNKIKTPFIYIAGELFDHVGHTASQDVAAMLRYDKNIDTNKTKALVNFSIEGSRLGKEGSEITKCIARKVTITITPCNKMALAEQMDEGKDNKTMGSKQNAREILEKFKKSEAIEVEILSKSFNNFMTSLAKPKGVNLKPKESGTRDFVNISATHGEHKEGSKIEPKRQFTRQNAPDKLKVGDRINHQSNKPKRGFDLYNDPNTFKSEGKRKKSFYESSVRKAITAGCGMGSPSSLSGGVALQKEDLDKKISKKEAYKILCDDSWSRFKYKDKIINIIEEKSPNLSKNEVLAIAKTYSYISEKKEENSLHDLTRF